MTIVTRGDDATLDQIVKQLNKLVNVLEVHDFREDDFIDRELVLVRVAVDARSRAEIMQMTDIFRAKIVDVQPRSLTIEITGNESKVEKFLGLMKTFGVEELTRTGKIALARKSSSIPVIHIHHSQFTNQFSCLPKFIPTKTPT